MMVTPEACSVRTTSYMPLRNSTSTPAVGSSRNRICGSCDKAFAIITRRFMPPDSVTILLSFLSHSDRSFSTFNMRGVLRLAEQAAAEADGCPYRLEGIGVQFLRHQPDQRSRAAIRCDDVVAIDRHRALARIGDAADDADQRGLAGAVRSQQREDLAAVNLQVNAVEGLETGAIGLGQIGNGYNGWHTGIGGK